MKTETRVLDVVSTLEGEKIGMTIHEDALAHIMSVLTDLYSDPELAIIREYSTNAFDAHVEAGQTRPIEVTTPTALSPFFKVRDYGAGLDIDDIRNIYSQYGASTKRESDEVVGMLGLGCKSALTYTDQFTMSAIKNGVATQVSISRDEDGAGSMTVVAEYPTDEPSGVEITVPVKSYNHLAHKAANFFRFWTEGTVLLNGEAPKRIDGVWIDDNLLLTQETDGDMIVMGNVAYPTPQDYYNRWSTVAFVNIGDVTFTPSREALQMTPKTKNKIEQIKAEVNEKRDIAIRKQIDEADSRLEALKLWQNGISMGYRGDATYKGQDIPKEFRADKDGIFTVVTAVKSWGSRGWNREVTLPIATAAKSIWLTGYTEEGFTPYKRKKMAQWLAKQTEIQDHRNLTLILVDKLPQSDWIDPKKVYDWADIAAEKIVRHNNGSTPRAAGTYKMVIVNGEWKYDFPVADVDVTKPLYFINQSQMNVNAVGTLQNLHPKGFSLVVLGKNRLAKFQRDFPKAKEINANWFRETAQKWLKRLSKNAQIALALKVNGIDHLAKFDAEQIDDPKLAALIEGAKFKDIAKVYDNWRRLYQNWIDLPKADTKVLDNYPLLTSSGRYGIINDKTKEHLYLYFNAVSAAEQEQN